MLFKNVCGMSLTPWGLYLNENKNLPTTMAIGLGLFKDRVILLDYKNNRLLVSEYFPALGINVNDGWIELPLKHTHEGIIVKTSQNLNDYNLVLDTASTVSLIWRNRLKPPIVNFSCQHVLKDMDNKGCVASAFRLVGTGAKKIDVNAVILDGKLDHLGADGLIGNNFFQKYAVLIDFPGKRLFIKENI